MTQEQMEAFIAALHQTCNYCDGKGKYYGEYHCYRCYGTGKLASPFAEKIAEVLSDYELLAEYRHTHRISYD